MMKTANALLSSGIGYKEVEAITGISKSTMIREKRKELKQITFKLFY